MTTVAEGLSPTDLRKLKVKLEKEAARRVSENKLASFKAYKKQREFFAAGKKHRVTHGGQPLREDRMRR
jgi:hypothetical protein